MSGTIIPIFLTPSRSSQVQLDICSVPDKKEPWGLAAEGLGSFMEARREA